MTARGASRTLDRAIKDYHAKIAEYDAARIDAALSPVGGLAGTLIRINRPAPSRRRPHPEF